jgi:hypothetical protein
MASEKRGISIGCLGPSAMFSRALQLPETERTKIARSEFIALNMRHAQVTDDQE